MPTFPYFYGISARFRPAPEGVILTKISWGFLGPVAPNPQHAPERQRISPRQATPRQALTCSIARN
ncbi:hypothetical protein ACVIGB_001738 [Bradyrhizobium sp. USDA 4341]